MKKIALLNYVLITFLLLFINTNASAQLENANWYFGIEAGINFNDGTQTPTVLTDNPLYFPNASASVSDEFGNLLFHTDGENIYNKNHNVMLNGSGLYGDAESSTVLIVKKPLSLNSYYVFTTEANLSSNNGLNYSIVDNSLGILNLGGVLTKNVNLLPQASQKMAVTRSTDGVNYWLIVLAPSTDPTVSDTLYSFKIDASGISLENQTTFAFSGDMHNAEGQMKVSADNQTIGLVHNTIDSSTGITTNVFTFDFDDLTGLTSNMKSSFGLTDSYVNYGIEFSPDSNMMYVSEVSDVTDITGKLYQIQHRDTMPELTKYLVHDNLRWGAIYAIQRRADDGKIYTAPDPDYLGIIDNPNGVGVNCNYIYNGIELDAYEIGPDKGLPQLVPEIITEPEIVIVSILKSSPKVMGNPFNDELKIEFEENRTYTTKLYDSSGLLAKTDVFTNSNYKNVHKISTSDLQSNNTYFIVIEDEDSKVWHNKAFKIE
tara:strand:+ start:729134 stop:730594 length:1461 start_codon:yes stop_codon:yes gene_type:complete